MSYQPVLPMGGVAGWQFLSRTRAVQQATHAASAQISRDVDYFKAKIGKVTSSEALVADRRLLSVALGAFGLDADINSKAFIRKVLDGGTFDTTSLANRLADKRYRQLAEAFGFGDIGLPNTLMPDFAEKIVAAYKERQFEMAVGQQQPELRLAMAFTRDLAAAVSKQNTENGRWYALMGNPPLREVMQKALGLPASFGRLDIDRQLDSFRQAAKRTFGTDDLTQLSQPDLAQGVIRRFLVRSEVEALKVTSAGQMALTLLQAAKRPG